MTKTNKTTPAPVTVVTGEEFSLATANKWQDLLAQAVASDGDAESLRGKTERLLYALSIRASNDHGFIIGLPAFPGYDKEAVTALETAIKAAFKAAGANDAYQRKVCQRVRDYACEYGFQIGQGTVNAPPKVLKAGVENLDDEGHEAMVAKADRTVPGAKRKAAASEAAKVAEKALPPLSKEAKAAKAAEDNRTEALAFIEKAIAKIAKLPVSNVQVAAQHNLLDTKKMLEPSQEG